VLLKATQADDAELYHSGKPVVVFIRIMPFVGVPGLCAVVPTGTVKAPVPPPTISPCTCVNAMMNPYAVYVPDEVKV
jgi:hypothetical protein